MEREPATATLALAMSTSGGWWNAAKNPLNAPRTSTEPSLRPKKMLRTRSGLIFRSEMSDTLSDMYRNTRGEGFGAECKRRIMLGTYVLSAGYYDAYYLKAQKVRTLIARDFARAFEEVDAIVAPVSPFPAFRLGEKMDDPLAMYLSDIYTITGSLAGIPCMSVPCGRTAGGLPVGMQLLTTHFGEPAMFRLAGAFEEAGGPN